MLYFRQMPNIGIMQSRPPLPAAKLEDQIRFRNIHQELRCLLSVNAPTVNSSRKRTPWAMPDTRNLNSWRIMPNTGPIVDFCTRQSQRGEGEGAGLQC